MAHDNHNLAIFRGAVKIKSNVQKIWGVFVLKLLNWVFIILTIVKAYYITWDFMHMRDEKSGLRRSVVWTGIFLIAYLVLILLIEGDYIFEIYKENYIKFDF